MKAAEARVVVDATQSADADFAGDDIRPVTFQDDA
jgi:hypothetical protein